MCQGQERSFRKLLSFDSCSGFTFQNISNFYPEQSITKQKPQSQINLSASETEMINSFKRPAVDDHTREHFCRELKTLS